MKLLYEHTSSFWFIFGLLLIILQCISLSKCSEDAFHRNVTADEVRRVLEGKEPTYNRSYVVYFIKADESVQYDAWLCGGAIVSPWYILTSAACVEDVKHMYAIAGYNKYVHYEQLAMDACANFTKRKIIFKCLPRDYKFDYPRVERWANIDLALVQVEKAFDFIDTVYLEFCSYIPSKIEINYDKKLQEPGTNAIVFGWGHVQKWRQTDDTIDYNQDFLLYGSVQLAPKPDCMEHFDNEIFKSIIEKYMICSLSEGNLDDSGDLIKDGKDVVETFVRDCGPGALRIGGKCVYIRGNKKPYGRYTRKKGICQNDHGGPIITWRGPKEVLIGISSVFKVEDRTSNCAPPFLYTSTYCNGEFIHCLMTSAEDGTMKEEDMRRCDALAKQGGLNIIRRTISWIGHRDGPAYNELQANSNIKLRHQIPIQRS